MKKNILRLFLCIISISIFLFNITVINPSTALANHDPESEYDETGNIFLNGNFNKTTSWSLTFTASGTGRGSTNIDTTEKNMLFKVQAFPSLDYHMRFSHSNTKIIANKNYKLSFLMKSNKRIEYTAGREIAIEVYTSNNTLVQVTNPDKTKSYFKYLVPPMILEEDEWVKVEWNIDTSQFAAGMTTETYIIKFNIGGAQKLTDDPEVELRFDNLILKEEMTEAALGILLEGTDSSNVEITGERNYQIGDKVTITAAVKEGKNYTFDRWVDIATNATISRNATYSFIIDGNKTYKAIFKALPKYSVNVDVNDASLGNVELHENLYDYGDTINLIAVPSGNGEFVCWEENGIKVSENLSLTVEVKGNHRIKANFAEIGKHKVTFRDEGGRIFKVESVADGNGATAPVDTFKAGYIFDGWDKTYDKITADTVVTAKYKQQDTLYAVSVENGVIENFGSSNSSGSYKFDTQVTIRPDNFANFSFWQDGTGKIVSYDSTYSFYVSGNTSLTAVSNAADVQKLPVIAINNIIAGNGTVSFIAQCTNPAGSGIIIQEYGVLLSQNYDTGNPFNLGTESGVIRGRAASMTSTGQFMITKVNAGGKKWYGRAYVIYKYGENVFTVYSDVASGTGL